MKIWIVAIIIQFILGVTLIVIACVGCSDEHTQIEPQEVKELPQCSVYYNLGTNEITQDCSGIKSELESDDTLSEYFIRTQLNKLTTRGGYELSL